MSVNNNSISVFQKQWAFTTANSDAPVVKTGSFGPCYAATFTKGEYAALAHIDDSTQVESIQNISTRFQQEHVEPKDVRVIVTGGWKEHPESAKWGGKVVKELKGAGFTNVNTALMHVKHATPPGIGAEQVNNHYFLGLQVDARNGKTSFIHKADHEHENKQHEINQQSLLAVMMGRARMDQEYPLTEVTSTLV